VGVYDDGRRPIMAAALGKLGVARAWVVRSEDGLDELSPSGPTRVSVLDGGKVTELVVTPADFGMATTHLDALRGGDAPANAAAIVAMLAGEDHPAVGAVVLNAAAALALVRGGDLRACADEARSAIASGRARDTFEGWRRAAVERRDAVAKEKA
jgi:anthranilate phosphoribosyltransferase